MYRAVLTSIFFLLTCEGVSLSANENFSNVDFDGQQNSEQEFFVVCQREKLRGSRANSDAAELLFPKTKRVPISDFQLSGEELSILFSEKLKAESVATLEFNRYDFRPTLARLLSDFVLTQKPNGQFVGLLSDAYAGFSIYTAYKCDRSRNEILKRRCV